MGEGDLKTACEEITAKWSAWSSIAQEPKMLSFLLLCSMLWGFFFFFFLFFFLLLCICSFHAELAGTVMAGAQSFAFLKTWVEKGDNMLLFDTGYGS